MLSGILLGIAIDVVIIVVLIKIGKKRNRLSYSEYLDRYGDLGPYDSSDIDKYT